MSVTDARRGAPWGASTPGPRRRARSTLGSDWVAALSCGLVAALVQGAFLQPPRLSDQLHYFLDARTLPAISEPAHQALRIGLLIPLRGLIEVLGPSLAAYHAIPLLSIAGLAVATFWLARQLASPVVAIGAALVATINPLVLAEGGELLPDLPAAALFTAAAALLVGVARRLREGTIDRRRADRWLLLAGALVGWAYLVRELIAVALPVLVVLALVHGLPWRRWLAPAAAAFGALVIEWGWGLVFFSDPLIRVRSSLNQPETPAWREPLVAELRARGTIPDTPLDNLVALPRSMVGWGGVGWLLVVLALVTVVAGVIGWRRRRDRSLVTAAPWVAVPWLVVTGIVLGLGLFDARILRPEKLRYWAYLWPGLGLGAALLVGALGRRVARGPGTLVAVAGLVAAVVVPTFGALSDRPVYTSTQATDLGELRTWLAATDCGLLWAGTGHWRATTRVLPIAARTTFGTPVWDGEVRSLTLDDRAPGATDAPLAPGGSGGLELRRAGEVDDGLVLRSAAAVERLEREGVTIPAYLDRALPAGWERTFATSNGDFEVLVPPDSGCA